MRFGRDLAAAMTFGLSATTKHKEAEAKHGDRQKQHERILNSYNEVQAQIQSGVEAMDAHFAAAQQVLLSTGALTGDVNNNVIYRAAGGRPRDWVGGREYEPGSWGDPAGMLGGCSPAAPG